MKFSEMPYNRIDMDEVKSFFTQLIEDSKNAKAVMNSLSFTKNIMIL